MVDRYVAGAFSRYCQLRRLTPAGARAELELLDDLVLKHGLSPARAGRRAVGAAPAMAKPAVLAEGRHRDGQQKGFSWTR